MSYGMFQMISARVPRSRQQARAKANGFVMAETLLPGQPSGRVDLVESIDRGRGQPVSGCDVHLNTDRQAMAPSEVSSWTHGEWRWTSPESAVVRIPLGDSGVPCLCMECSTFRLVVELY